MSKIKHFLVALGLVLISLNSISIYSPILAQEGGIGVGEDLSTNPKDREVTVTALVPDIIDPSVPILIDPENNELISTSLPTFIWTQSTDNVGVDHYELTLDGSVKYDDIPTSTSETSSYSLYYNSSTGNYELTVKQVISDGTHTWSITAYDAAGNFAESVTWTFKIDSQAPAFIITDIGELETNISAQNTDSVPDEPVELDENEPLLIGTGEANSNVTVTISTGGGRTPGSSSGSSSTETILDTDSFSIDGSGNWQLQLGILPRDTVITLDFTITDSAGNVTLLEGVQIIIPTEYIIIPPPVEELPLPEPVKEIIEQITEVVPPIIPIPTIIIEKPEIQEEVVKIVQVVEKLLPSDLRNYLALSPIIVRPGLKMVILSLLALILVIAPRLMSLIILSARLGGIPTPNQLKMLLMVIGWWPRKQGGLVFETDQQRPLPFAKVIFIGKDKQLTEVRKTVFTDQNGIYPHIELPEGEYLAHVEYEGTLFPSSNKKSEHIAWYNYYKSEVLEVTEEQTQHTLIIPVDLMQNSQGEVPANIPKNLITRSLLILCFPRLLPNLLYMLAWFVTILYPSLINILAVLGYTLALLSYWWSKTHPTHRIKVLDQVDQKLKNVVFRSRKLLPDNSLEQEFGVTDKRGELTTHHTLTEAELQLVYYRKTIKEPEPNFDELDHEYLVIDQPKLTIKLS